MMSIAIAVPKQKPGRGARALYGKGKDSLILKKRLRARANRPVFGLGGESEARQQVFFLRFEFFFAQNAGGFKFAQVFEHLH